MRKGLQDIEAQAAALTVERMEAEAEWNINYSNENLLVDAAKLNDFKKCMEKYMKQSSNDKMGFIVWLIIDNTNLPLFIDIKAEKILPTGPSSNAAISKLNKVAERFDDLRFKKDFYRNTCSFTEMRLSTKERVYIDHLKIDPMKFAKEVANDWLALPLIKLEVEDKVFIIIY